MVPKHDSAKVKQMELKIKAINYRVYGSLGETKEWLRDTAKNAYLSFTGEGRQVTVCRPAVAIGSGFTPNKHPRNRIVGAQSPLTV